MSGTNYGSSSLPPAGWHVDPANSALQRWWDGKQWTNYVQEPPQPVGQQAPLPGMQSQTPQWQDPQPAPSSASSTPYEPMSRFSTVSGQTANLLASRSGSPNTLPIWYIALFPLISTVPQVIAYLSLPTKQAVPVMGAVWLASVVFLLVSVFWDASLLRRRNLTAASGAWIFLSVIAYLVARWVSLRRGGTNHAAPGVVFIVIMVLFASLYTAAIFVRAGVFAF